VAVSASFQADFSQFNKAVEKAEDQLRAFGLEPVKVEKSLARLTSVFDGRNLIAGATEAANAIESIGGVSKLSEAELQKVGTQAQAAVEKLRLMGKDVPQNLQALADAVKKPSAAMEFLNSTVGKVGAAVAATFSIGAIVGAVSRTVEWAGRIDDLSNKLGLSVESVQRLDFAARQNGSSIDQVSTAMALLSKHVTANDDGFKRLGLRVEELRGLNQEELFRRVGVAIAALPSKTEQLAAAQQLLGRSGAALIPTFMNLEKDMARAVVASEESIKAGDQLGDAWDALKTTGAVLLSTVITPFAPGLNAAAAAATNFARELEYVQRAKANLLKSGGGSESRLIGGEVFDDTVARETALAAETIRLQLDDMTKAAVKAGDSLWNMGKPLPVVAKGMDDAAAAEKRLNSEIKATTEALSLQNRLMGGDAVEKAMQMIAALESLTAKGIRPTKAATIEIVDAMKAAQTAMMETGQAGTAAFGKLEETITRFKGLTKDGLLPSTNFGVGTALAPLVEVDAAMQTLITRAHERNAAEAAWSDTFKESIAYADEAAELTAKALEAQAAGAAAATSGFQQTTAAAREAAAAIAILVPLGTSITEAYRDAGLFVNDAASPLQGKGVRRSGTHAALSFANGSNGYQDFGSGTPAMLHGVEKVVPLGKSGGDGATVHITVNASGLDSPAARQAIADQIDQVMRSRFRSMGVGF